MASEATLKNRETRDNSKIESMAEAVESMALAVATVMITRCKNEKVPQSLMDCLVNARTDLRNTLREFMRPNLNLLAGGHQEDATIPDAERLHCGRCGKTIPCSTNCMSWHRAVKAAEAPAETDDEPPRAA